MKEANFQTFWHHYLNDNPPDKPEVYELKLCKTNRFSLAQVKDHQIDGLLKAQLGLFHKISDSPIFSGMMTRFTAKKPFDCLWIKADAFVCVMYYIPRKPKYVAKIPILVFMELLKIFPKKSITLDEVVTFGAERIKL